MSNLINPSAKELRAALIEALGNAEGGNPLGQYKRPGGLPNIPAIWVGRSIPDKYTPIVSAREDPNPAPAMEVVIDAFPEYQVEAGNFNSLGLLEGWRIYLVFHDDRQFPRAAIRAIAQNFQIVSDILPLPANDQRPYQYSLLITYKNRLPQRGR